MAMVSIKKILVPVDFSENSLKAIKYSLAIAKDRKSKVYFLHVINQRIVDAIYELSVRGYQGSNFAELMDNVRAEKENELRSVVPEELSEGIEKEFVVKQGRPAKVIVNVAKELDIDLVVIGFQGRSTIGELVLGSVALYVVNNAPCPVLVVHPVEKEFIST